MNGPVPLSAAAVELLTEWLPTNEDTRRPRVSLATAGETNTPDVRTVLLTDWTPDGFAFTTENLTRKVADLMANPRVALGFLLRKPLRQLSVQGTAVRMGRDEADAAFRRASRDRQLLAHLNTNDFARLADDERARQWDAFAEEHPDDQLETPEGWSGYRVQPDRLTFWTDSAHGSRRTEFSLTGGEWVTQLLPG